MKEIWLFFQNQILGMNWLNELIALLLTSVGIDINSNIGASIQFFIYDVIKITVLLCVLIFMISYIQSYFPPERSKKILGRFLGIKSKYHFCFIRYSNAFLFMFIYTAIYWIYKCWLAIRSHFLIFDFFTYG